MNCPEIQGRREVHTYQLLTPLKQERQKEARVLRVFVETPEKDCSTYKFAAHTLKCVFDFVGVCKHFFNASIEGVSGMGNYKLST